MYILQYQLHSNLLDLIQLMVIEFNEEPPVFSKSNENEEPTLEEERNRLKRELLQLKRGEVARGKMEETIPISVEIFGIDHVFTLSQNPSQEPLARGQSWLSLDEDVQTYVLATGYNIWPEETTKWVNSLTLEEKSIIAQAWRIAKGQNYHLLTGLATTEETALCEAIGNLRQQYQLEVYPEDYKRTCEST